MKTYLCREINPDEIKSNGKEKMIGQSKTSKFDYSQNRNNLTGRQALRFSFDFFGFHLDCPSYYLPEGLQRSN